MNLAQEIKDKCIDLCHLNSMETSIPFYTNEKGNMCIMINGIAAVLEKHIFGEKDMTMLTITPEKEKEEMKFYQCFIKQKVVSSEECYKCYSMVMKDEYPTRADCVAKNSDPEEETF